MELIYLWTKKYKNLEGGYKLSSKYNVKYEKEIIHLEPNSFFIDNFFDEKNKINITAIIGENGSGKSSIMKLIIQLLYADFSSKNELNKDSFLIVEIETKFYCIYTNNRSQIKLKINGENREFSTYDKNFYTIYFNYMLDSLKDDSTENWIDDIYHKSDDYTVPILLEPYKKDNNVNINNLNYLTRQRMILHKQSFDKNKFLSDIFEPIEVTVKIDTNKVIKILTLPNDSKKYHFTHEIKNNYESIFSDIYSLIKEISKQEELIQQLEKDSADEFDIQSKKEDLTTLYNNLDDEIYNIPLFILNKLYIANKIDKYNIINSQKISEGKIGAMTIGSKLLIRNVVFEGDNVGAEIMDETHSTLKLRNAIKFHEYIVPSYESNLTLLNKEKTFSIEDKRLQCLPSWFEVKFRDKHNRTFTSLSAGEKSFYILLTTLIYQINNIVTRMGTIRGAYYHVLIMLDEADLGLHPKWQRQYLYNIVETLKETSLDLSYHVICTSHSPFIVSDLPKDNILFLDKGKSSNLQDILYTFGENIHTLLNDSFFMQKDMMMGKIAEHKLRDCFDFFEKIFENDKEIEKIEMYYVDEKSTEKKDSNLKNKLNRLKENKDNLKIKYEKNYQYYHGLQNIIGEEYLQIAFKNSLDECNKLFNISDEHNLSDRDRLIKALEKDPSLATKLIKDIE
ncbi:hypothetical protein YH65_04115 [Sulfurovum lithotrophicum]|uniref:AAA+ ATPase domain-containing protein n=1 Tax=Sulfurovum lithotrophicum TaxID=206403 RepID=A0A7U4M0K7_9BACT|nr:AAA family ATPase [Sulfurovum lithotrophicum]AKF24659.1 hypothetical protein YH65_04115 [Sulfurovum lithotrophicum]